MAMKMKNVGLSAAARVERGSATLAAAEFVDVKVIRAGLDAFGEAQRAYAEAHQAVETAETALRAGQDTLLGRDREQDAAVEELARALVHERQPRQNPFAAFGMPAPSRIKSLDFGEQAKAIRQLVAAVHRNGAASEATREAALAADRAAQAVESELMPVQKLVANVRATRATRTIAETRWKQALGILKRCARVAASQGAPGLYEALFGPPNRAKKKAPAVTAASDSSTTPAPIDAGQVDPVPTQ